MKKIPKIILLSIALTSLMAGEVLAFAGFVAKLPTGQFQCSTCHTNPGGGNGWNSFGLAVRDSLVNGAFTYRKLNLCND